MTIVLRIHLEKLMRFCKLFLDMDAHASVSVFNIISKFFELWGAIFKEL